MGLKMIFYLTNVTDAVNLSQPRVCIGGGLHAPIHIFLGKIDLRLPSHEGLISPRPTGGARSDTWCLLPGLQEGQGLQIGLLGALGERFGAEVHVSR